MGGTPKSDPVRATLLAILKQLNQAETVHEGTANDQAAATPLVRRRPGYPGCRHFNENYIGSWLLDPALPTMSRQAGH